MIVSKDINPEREVYYLGAKIIEIIASKSGEVDFLDLYQKIRTQENVLMDLYSLTLSWLYIVGALENSEEGKIRKCF